MTVPVVVATPLTAARDRPLLVVGPSLGTSVTALWERCAQLLEDDFYVVGWDLPGHGASPAPTASFSIQELARGVMEVADRSVPGGMFVYAGVSVGGAVGQQLLLDAPLRVSAAALLCTGAKIGEASSWHERADLVDREGTGAVVDGSADRWFAPGFEQREPQVRSALLSSLRATDASGYSAVCRALADFDVRDHLASIVAPVLAVAGADDVATPPSLVEAIATGVARGRSVVLDDVGHLAPTEAPTIVAALLRTGLGAGRVTRRRG